MLGVTPDEVATLHEEVPAYHAEFAPCCRREEQRHGALKYTGGQLLPVERQAIEPLAAALEGGDAQALPQFIGLGARDGAGVLAAPQRLVAATLGDAAPGVLIVGGCAFPKQGTHAVGVARQCCGPLGKVANCPATTLACCASARGYALVDRRPSLPADWCTDAYRGRRRRCGRPAGTPFQTRTELAWAMIAGRQARGAPPSRRVTGAEPCGFAEPIRLLDQPLFSPHGGKLRWKVVR